MGRSPDSIVNTFKERQEKSAFSNVVDWLHFYLYEACEDWEAKIEALSRKYKLKYQLH